MDYISLFSLWGRAHLSSAGSSDEARLVSSELPVCIYTPTPLPPHPPTQLPPTPTQHSSLLQEQYVAVVMTKVLPEHTDEYLSSLGALAVH